MEDVNICLILALFSAKTWLTWTVSRVHLKGQTARDEPLRRRMGVGNDSLLPEPRHQGSKWTFPNRHPRVSRKGRRGPPFLPQEQRLLSNQIEDSNIWVSWPPEGQLNLILIDQLKDFSLCVWAIHSVIRLYNTENRSKVFPQGHSCYIMWLNFTWFSFCFANTWEEMWLSHCFLSSL